MDSNCAKAENINWTRETPHAIEVAVDEADAISRVAGKAGEGNEEGKCFPGHWNSESEGRIPVFSIRDIHKVDEVDEVNEEEEKYLSDKSKTMSDDVDGDD